ncbi:hypothetical protein FOF46_26780 [Aquimarina algiphila]|uniref:Uncharacterized protein n=3 Tax=Aquimarina algiphila TaxID=2047982 RepID=A0A554VC79_9FLAO|nr:hypothetical protein [Aquimarina algiphila]TSE04264.1 hypothetical protein FOF46_26780 [Aquimarina algiphila]
MITYQEKIVQHIIRQFDGMSKIEVYDILQKIETLLFEHESPLEFKAIEKTLEKQSIKNILPLGSSAYCYLVDHSPYLDLYKIKSLIPDFLGGEKLYFTIPGQYEFIHYDNKNIEETFSNMHMGSAVSNFLKYNHAKKRNPKTKRFLLLELFDKIDPG